MNNKIELIKKLREETGVGIYEANKAIELCEEIDVAKEFLRLYNQALLRYKFIDGKKIPYEIEDYVLLAKNIVNKK